MRAINLWIFESDDQDYLRRGAFGLDSHRRTMQRIRNVPGRKVSQILRAVPPFQRSSFRGAWSHWMALGCGRHLWPDGNHRTAYYAFTAATRQQWGLNVSLDAGTLADAGERSKAMRDEDYRARDRYYTVADLDDSGHPYRRLFAAYEDQLVLEPAF